MPVPKRNSNKTGVVQGTNWASAHIATGPLLRRPLAACGSHGKNGASPHRARSFSPHGVLAPPCSHCFTNWYRLPFVSSVIVALHRYAILLDFPGCGCIHVGCRGKMQARNKYIELGLRVHPSTQIRSKTLLRFEVQHCASCHLAVFQSMFMNCAALATGSASIEMSSDMSQNISYLGTQPNKQLLGTVWECCTSRSSRLWTNSERRSTPSPVKSQTHWPSWRITSNYSVLIRIPSKVKAALPLHLASGFVLSRARTTTWGQSLFSWQNTPALPHSNHVWCCSRQSMTVEFQHVVPLHIRRYPETSHVSPTQFLLTSCLYMVDSNSTAWGSEVES